MKRISILAAMLLLLSNLAISQGIVKGTGILYTNGVPTLVATQSADAEIAIDTTTGFWYEYNRDALAWSAAGYRIQLRTPCTTPTHTPGDKQSYILLDTCDNLYRYRNGVWTQINAGGGGGATDLGYSGTSSPVTLTSSTGTDVTITQGGIVTVTASGSNMTISATETDGSVTNEGQLGVGAGGSTSSTLITNTSGGNAVTINAAGILAITETTSSNGGSITLTATEVDGSTSNELQTIANTSNSTSHTATLSNSGGSVQLVEGTGIGLATTGTSSDGIVTITNTSPDQTVSITGAGINVVTGTYPNFTITGTEVDGSTSNELQTIANTSDATSHTVTLSNSGGSIQLVEGSNITLTTTGTSGAGVVTIAATNSTPTANNGVSDNEDSGKLRLGNRYMNSPDAPFTMDRKLNLSGFHFYLGDNSDSTLLHIDGTNDKVGIHTTAPGRTLSVNGEVEIKDLATTNATAIVGADGNGVLSEITVGTGLDLTAGVLTATGGGGGGSTDLSYTGTSSPITLNSSTGTDVTITQGGIVTVTASGSNMTISATEVDGSTSNELQTYSHAGTTTYTNTLSNGGGSWSITGAGIAAVSQTGGAITVTATEVDGSVTNEGQLGVGAGGASSSTILSNTSGSTGITVNAAGILAITESTSSNGGSITLTATEVDGSTSNELQTIANTSDATSHTVTLSNSGGSIKLAEGSNITLTTTGTSGDGVVTIASTGTADGNGPYSGNGGNGGNGTIPSVTTSTLTNQWTLSRATDDVGGLVPLRISVAAGNEPDFMSFVNGSDSLLISKGDQEFQIEANKTLTIQSTDRVFIVGDSISISTIPNGVENERTLLLVSPAGTVVKSEGLDPDIINQNSATSGQVLKWNGTKWAPAAEGAGTTDLSYTGTSSPITLNSSTGTDVTITQGGIVSVTASGSNMTISATEVDGSVTNELQTYSHAGTTTYTNTLSNGGGSWSITGAGIAAISQTGGAVTVTATEVDGSLTNEGQLGVGAGGATSSVLLSNTSGATGVTINVGGINAISETTSSNGGQITITATEVDGSTSNELQTIANTSDATSHTVTLSNSGGSVKLAEGSNITLTTTGTSGDGVVTIAATGSIAVANNGLSDNENSGNIRLGNRYMNSSDGPFSFDRKINLNANKFYIGDNTDSTLLQIDGTNDRVGIGTTTPGRKLTVNGEVEIKDLTTTSATVIVGADGNGVLSEIAVGSGLSLSAGTLTATGGGSGDILNNGNSFAAAFVVGTNDNNTVSLEQNGTNVLTIGTDKNITVTNSVAATNTVTDQVKLNINSSGTAAANFGGGILFSGESSTTNDQEMARLRSYWTNATHANREAAFSFMLGDNGGALTETMKVDRDANLEGILTFGTTTPVYLTNALLQTSRSFTVGASVNQLTVGGLSGGVEILRETSSTGSPVAIELEAQSTGTPAAGFGVNLSFVAESATTGNFREQGNVQTVWTTATDASRTADMVVNLTNSASSGEKFRVYGNSRAMVGGGTNQASAAFQVNSTTGGLLGPRVTDTEMGNIASPAEGLEVYNTTIKGKCVYNGTAWQRISCAVSPSIATGTGAGTGATASISGSDLGGVITVTAGTTPATNATVVTVTFNTAFKTAPKAVLITAADNDASAVLFQAAGSRAWFVEPSNISTTVFTVNSGSAVNAATNGVEYKLHYSVIQ